MARRVLDVVCSALGPLIAPFVVLVAAFVLLDSARSVFFRRERVRLSSTILQTLPPRSG